ncbi:hypothetical protein CLV78_10578 [Aliiruegeria haliotis]|uniref:Flagellar FliJ protein n=1 Tax=Aliiruegeria haliotis TaxID=1280846 RepID=A0A2T0RPB3_9RHOB|nr:hypothetical protein [Aliiruegeria haliotis]PRY23026.1 hypothetical protein CLV78_10578 [Aliiruegeria haliotis]
MKLDARKLAALQNVTRAKWDACSQDLRQAVREEQQIQRQLDRLADRKRQYLEVLASDDPATWGEKEAVLKWIRWFERERRNLICALAKARVNQEVERNRTRESFGRNQAVNSLLERAGKLKRQTEARNV